MGYDVQYQMQVVFFTYEDLVFIFSMLCRTFPDQNFGGKHAIHSASVERFIH